MQRVFLSDLKTYPLFFYTGTLSDRCFLTLKFLLVFISFSLCLQRNHLCSVACVLWAVSFQLIYNIRIYYFLLHK